MVPQQNSIEAFGVGKKTSEEKGRSMPKFKFVRSVRSGHLIMSFPFLVSRSHSVESSEVRICVRFRIGW